MENLITEIQNEADLTHDRPRVAAGILRDYLIENNKNPDLLEILKIKSNHIVDNMKTTCKNRAPMKYSVLLVICLICLPIVAFAQETNEHHSLGDIAREIKNPVSLLYRVPFRNDFEVGDVDNQFRYTLRAQPVVPFIINKNWKIITRSSLSLIANQFNGVDGSGPTGLNDLDLTVFLAPMKSMHGFVWGVGGAIDMPTATDYLLGAGKWTAGPSILALKQTKVWTFGLVARQVWSFAGDPDRTDVNYAYFNPWIYYTFENGFGLSLLSEMTINWNGDENTVPLRFGASQVFKMGKKWIGNIDLDGIYYIETPVAGSKWGVSITFTMLLKHIAYVKK